MHCLSDYALPPCGGEKKIKKRRGGKNSFWVGEKNTLLQALVCGLACSGLQECIFLCGCHFLFYSSAICFFGKLNSKQVRIGIKKIAIVKTEVAMSAVWLPKNLLTDDSGWKCS